MIYEELSIHLKHHYIPSTDYKTEISKLYNDYYECAKEARKYWINYWEKYFWNHLSQNKNLTQDIIQCYNNKWSKWDLVYFNINPSLDFAKEFNNTDISENKHLTKDFKRELVSRCNDIDDDFKAKYFYNLFA